MASLSQPNQRSASPRLPRPQTQASVLLPSSSSSSSLSIAAASSADADIEAGSPPPLPPVPRQQQQQMTLSSSYYSDVLRFEPPRSSSSYALHDYSSSPVRGEGDGEEEEEEGEGIPPVPPVDWPLPAGRVDHDVVVPIQAGSGIRESMTALPVPFMTEVYRPRPRPGPRTGSLDMLRLATTGNDGTSMVASEPLVGASFDGPADSAAKQSVEKKSLRQRIRKWFRRNSKSSVPPNPPIATAPDGSVPIRLRKRRQHSEPINALTYFEEQTLVEERPPGQDESASDDMSFLEALRTIPPGRSATVPTMPYVPQPFARPRPKWVAKEAGKAPAAEDGPRARQVGEIAGPRIGRYPVGPGPIAGKYVRNQTHAAVAASDTGAEYGDNERSNERLRKEYEALRAENEKLKMENDELRRSNSARQRHTEGPGPPGDGPPR